MNTTRTLGSITTLGLLLMSSAPAMARAELMSERDLMARAQRVLLDFPQLGGATDFESVARYRAERAKALFSVQALLSGLKRQGVDTGPQEVLLGARAGDGAKALLNVLLTSLDASQLSLANQRMRWLALQVPVKAPRRPRNLADREALAEYENELMLMGAQEAKRRELEALATRLADRYAAVTGGAGRELVRPQRSTSFQSEQAAYSRALREQRTARQSGGAKRRLMELFDQVPPAPEDTVLGLSEAEAKDLVPALVRNPDGSQSHRLAQGESTRDVALRYGISVTQLRQANPGLSRGDWRPGKLIRLPHAQLDTTASQVPSLEPYADQPLGE